MALHRYAHFTHRVCPKKLKSPQTGFCRTASASLKSEFESQSLRVSCLTDGEQMLLRPFVGDLCRTVGSSSLPLSLTTLTIPQFVSQTCGPPSPGSSRFVRRLLKSTRWSLELYDW